jgi:hypothetical protein
MRLLPNGIRDELPFKRNPWIFENKEMTYLVQNRLNTSLPPRDLPFQKLWWERLIVFQNWPTVKLCHVHVRVFMRDAWELFHR